MASFVFFPSVPGVFHPRALTQQHSLERGLGLELERPDHLQSVVLGRPLTPQALTPLLDSGAGRRSSENV